MGKTLWRGHITGADQKMTDNVYSTLDVVFRALILTAPFFYFGRDGEE